MKVKHQDSERMIVLLGRPFAGRYGPAPLVLYGQRENLTGVVARGQLVR